MSRRPDIAWWGWEPRSAWERDFDSFDQLYKFHQQHDPTPHGVRILAQEHGVPYCYLNQSAEPHVLVCPKPRNVPLAHWSKWLVELQEASDAYVQLGWCVARLASGVIMLLGTIVVRRNDK